MKKKKEIKRKKRHKDLTPAELKMMEEEKDEDEILSRAFEQVEEFTIALIF